MLRQLIEKGLKSIKEMNLNLLFFSEILLALLKKYKDYDSTLVEHYDPNSLFFNRKNANVSSNVENTNVAIIEYKEPLFKRILNKLKNLFNMK